MAGWPRAGRTRRVPGLTEPSVERVQQQVNQANSFKPLSVLGIAPHSLTVSHYRQRERLDFFCPPFDGPPNPHTPLPFSIKSESDVAVYVCKSMVIILWWVWFGSRSCSEW